MKDERVVQQPFARLLATETDRVEYSSDEEEEEVEEAPFPDVDDGADAYYNRNKGMHASRLSKVGIQPDLWLLAILFREGHPLEKSVFLDSE